MNSYGAKVRKLDITKNGCVYRKVVIILGFKVNYLDLHLLTKDEAGKKLL